VFDTETTVEPCQRLLVGGWRFYRDLDEEPGTTCIEEGLFYPDDLPERDADGFDRLVAYAAQAPTNATPGYSRMGGTGMVELWPVSRWLEERLFRKGVQRRDRCDVVGFNLLFDLGRLATHWGPAEKYYYGGFTLGIWGDYDAEGTWRDAKFHPRVLIRSIDPRRTLFGWGNLKRGDASDQRPARMVDLRTLAFALTDESHTLESACGAFGDPDEKEGVAYGAISYPLLEYLRDDVEHTAILYSRCVAELRRHEGIELKASALYSPASVGVKYLEAMGLQRPGKKFTSVSDETHGRAMSGFYGGRAEARIVRVPVPVAHVDATAMYPTVAALLGTWDIVRAAEVEIVDVAEEVRALLADARLSARCYERSFWREAIGVTLVEVADPDGVVLPVRGYYDPRSPDPGIGVNALTYHGRLWYLLPDVIAAVLLSDVRVPTVVRAIRLQGVGIQDVLRSVRLRGGREVDPRTEDPFVAMVEERHRVRKAPLLKAERDRLERFMKITANATVYGAFARFDRRDLPDAVEVKVYGSDEEPTTARTKHPEDPGPFCFPPIAASLTSGARLFLAMLERAVTDAGGGYAFCDTDAMAIVTAADPQPIRCPTPDGTGVITPLKPDRVRRILRRFEALNPYDRTMVPSLWKAEHDSLRFPITCYAISAKRYALYREVDGRTEPVAVVDAPEQSSMDDIEPDETGMVDWSESGLGVYLDPRDPERPRRDDKGRRIWINEAWAWLLLRDPKASMPGWRNVHALTRFGVSSPAVRAWFSGFDASVEEDLRIRPGTFGLIAHPDGFMPLDPEAIPLPTSTYERQPDRWPGLNWYDRRTGEPVEVTVAGPGLRSFGQALEGHGVRVRALGDVLGTYAMRVEHKSCASDGSETAHDTVGLLARRPVESAPVLTDLTGKEANKLLERMIGVVTDPEEYRSDYGARADRWATLVLPVLQRIAGDEGIEGLMERANRGTSAVYEALAGAGRGQKAYLDAAVGYATEQLQVAGVDPPDGAYAILWCYLNVVGSEPVERVCEVCGHDIDPHARSDTRFCSERCRRAAYRMRHRE
jgi:hypothetical protein